MARGLCSISNLGSSDLRLKLLASFIVKLFHRPIFYNLRHTINMIYFFMYLRWVNWAIFSNCMVFVWGAVFLDACRFQWNSLQLYINLNFRQLSTHKGVNFITFSVNNWYIFIDSMGETDCLWCILLAKIRQRSKHLISIMNGELAT